MAPSVLNNERILIAKLNWSDYYQGEEPETTFSEGDNNERFNFRRRMKDGRFYGSIPKERSPQGDGEWLVVFIARAPDGNHYAVGWYENAQFKERSDRPEYRSDDDDGSDIKNFDQSRGNRSTYTVYAKEARLLPPEIRYYFKTPSMQHFGNATYIYARGPGAEHDADWRQEFANFAERVVAGDISRSVSAL